MNEADLNKRWNWLSPGLLAILLWGCVSPGEEERVRAARSAQFPSRYGHVEGIVRLNGEKIPSPTLVRNTTDPESCKSDQSLEDLLVSSKNRGIQNVILALGDVPAEIIPAFQPRRLRLDNRDCRFSPHASVMETGGVIEAVNSDPLHHTVHFYGALEANVSLPFQGVRVQKAVTGPGMIMVKCDFHGWMQAYIRVDDHPFHAVTGLDGTFRIRDVPAGRYVVEIWHERLGERKESITVPGGETVFLEIGYPFPGNASSK